MDMIHDAQLDYYGKRLATCSSDRTIRLFEAEGENNYRPIDVLKGHEGPVWQVAWAHPKYFNVLASCSYDSRVLIWRESNGTWSRIKEHTAHTASVNAIAWAPHEFGAILAAASSDGKVSLLSFKDSDATWETQLINAHSIGANAITWAPAIVPGTLIHVTGGAPASTLKRFASAGCDNLVKVWREENGTWKLEKDLEGHTDWVRDVAWAPNIGLPTSYLASCSQVRDLADILGLRTPPLLFLFAPLSFAPHTDALLPNHQDKTVIIWTQDSPTSEWHKKPLRADPFPDVVWRLSWSASGNILAVSCGDNKVTLWKENLDGEWGQIGDVNEGYQQSM
ncbi:GTPase-activating protein S13 [Rhizophlyctis rosea]|nr:GTPase-activating protein S13 [Rhizophlyctis rosea]